MNTETKHTPGPWHFDDQPDSYLIAQAPSLLEENRQLREALEELIDFAEMAYAEAFAHAAPPVTGMLIEGAQSITKATKLAVNRFPVSAELMEVQP